MFAWLVVGGEETEIRLLRRNLDPALYNIEVVACFRKPNMPEQTHLQLEALGVPVDRTPYDLSYESTVDYLANKIEQGNYDVIVGCQAVRDLYPALEKLTNRPPLIEHGGLVVEATTNPKSFTTRYVGVCDTIRQAAASAMPGREHHALEIPSMVDLTEFNPSDRPQVRQELGIYGNAPLIGWVGRLDRKKRVEDFIRAAGIVHKQHPEARFVVIGGPDAFMPEYADELKNLAHGLGLSASLQFLGDRPDVPRLLSGLDIFCWLSRDEGMPHVISEAGAASLPVIATRDNGSQEQITHNQTGLFVPHESPEEVASAIAKLISDPNLRSRLGTNLRRKVEREYSSRVLTAHWQALFEEVIAENA